MNSTHSVSPFDDVRPSADPLLPLPEFWKSIRENDFPILQTTMNGHPLAYLDSAASSQVPLPVLNRMTQHQTSDHGNTSRGVHDLSQRSTLAVEETRRLVAEHLGAPHPAECIFVRGATEGLNLVAAILRRRLHSGDNVVLTTLEHHSNIVPWTMLQQEIGFEIRVADIPDDRSPVLAETLATLVDSKTKVFGCVHVSNTLGTILDVASLIAVAKENNPEVIAVVDGCQATLHVDIDVQALGADFYAFSGHKMCAPTGIGVLWGRGALLEELPPYQGGGSMIASVSWEEVRYAALPAKFEAGTLPILPIIGLGATLTYLNALGWEKIHAREKILKRYMIDKLLPLEGVALLGPLDPSARVGSFSFVVGDVHPHDIGTIMSSKGVAIRAGHHCTQPLMKRLHLTATARASLAFYTTEQNINQFVNAIDSIKEIFG